MMDMTFNMSRVIANLGAIKELHASEPNQNLLKMYSGWGGLRKAIYNPHVYQKMKQVLSEQEILSIKKTFKTAYFTPPDIVNFIYKILAKSGIKPNKILEPSAGHGIFIELMPACLRQHAQITAIEIDAISCRLMKCLYPDIEVLQNGFELFNEKADFDLIVGNPPFGQTYVEDKHHTDIADFSVHHYFVAKSMRLLKQDGVLAMVLPRYFLDNRQKQVRDIIASEGGSLIAAFRLPDDLFNDAKVTVDVVFLKKVSGKLEWLNVKKIRKGERFAFINCYFLSHRQHVFGKLKFISVYGRTEISCRRIIKAEK
jgi:predicted RNA methylase